MNDDEGPVCTNGVYGCESQSEQSHGHVKEELIYCYECETYLCTAHNAEHEDACFNEFLLKEDEYYMEAI